MNKNTKKIIAGITLTIGLSVLTIESSRANYIDTETVSNSFTTTFMDMEISKSSISGFVGAEHEGELHDSSAVSFVNGSFDRKYDAVVENANAFCDDFDVSIDLDGDSMYTGPVSSMSFGPIENAGQLNFVFDTNAGVLSHNDQCSADLKLRAWPTAIANFSGTSFYDTETIDIDLTAKMIVLNEVLAYPDPGSSVPNEFIEIFNNGITAIDVDGWMISEITSGGNENIYTITTAGGSYTADPGVSSVISAGGYLVLNLSNSIALNNTGDTIRLYDSLNNQLDQYTYSTAKFGASDARVPDGIGEWIDPIPTPGSKNIVGEVPQFVDVVEDIKEPEEKETPNDPVRVPVNGINPEPTEPTENFDIETKDNSNENNDNETDEAIEETEELIIEEAKDDMQDDTSNVDGERDRNDNIDGTELESDDTETDQEVSGKDVENDNPDIDLTDTDSGEEDLGQNNDTNKEIDTDENNTDEITENVAEKEKEIEQELDDMVEEKEKVSEEDTPIIENENE